jgi:hypothetical protein
MMMAILGTLTPVLVFLGLVYPLGRGQAFITALLVALWPEHIYYSQENRFYVTAFLFASACTVAGSQVLARRSIPWTVLACLLAVAGVFTHTTLVLLLPGLLAAVAVAARPWRGRSLLSVLGIMAGFALLLGFLYLGYIKPLFGQWNSEVTWDYSSFRSLGNSLFHLGWPVALLGGFGALLALVRCEQQDRYWLTWAALWTGCSIVLPQFLPFRPAYSFPMALGLLVLAAKGIDWLYSVLVEQSRLAGAAWVVTACLLNFPALASHYLDGSCSNYRMAASHIRPRYQPEDILMAVSPDLLKYYLPDAGDPLTVELYVPQKAIEAIQQQQRSSGRVWVVLNYGRAIRPDELLEWLRSQGSHEFTWCRLRYDCFEYTTKVFLVRNDTKRLGKKSLPRSVRRAVD